MFPHHTPRQTRISVAEGGQTSVGQSPIESTPIATKPPGARASPGPSQFGAGLAKNASVWETYVKETDRWDSELVDGWNKSLDVILIFAALFSAISTAFVLESSKSLQQDPADTAAQTLAIISQTLLAMNGQGGASFPLEDQQNSEFTPSRSAVVINTLWFLSLSLSVGVSFVAILAKEWCYAFMSKRTGHPYNQARRRQSHWNGIKRWKMKEILTYLPMLMHLALLLFAAGLSLYLLEINTNVAIPVIVTTAMAITFYVTTTLLSLVYSTCPYITTLSMSLGAPFSWIRTRMCNWVFGIWITVHTPVWIANSLWKLNKMLDVEPLQNSEVISDELEEAAMDEVTSQILGWLVSHCEEPNSIEATLQALASIEYPLPREPLLKSNAIQLVWQRLESCFDKDQVHPTHPVLKDDALIAPAIRYTQALTYLMTPHKDGGPGWDKWTQGGKTNWPGVRLRTLVVVYKSLMSHVSETSRGNQRNELAVFPAVALIPAVHWSSGWILDTSLLTSSVTAARATIVSLIDKHVNKKTSLCPTMVLALVKASIHGLIERGPQEDSKKILPLLVQLLWSPNRQSLRIRHAVGIALSVSTIATYDHLGGTSPPGDASRKRRAVEVFLYYTDQTPNEREAMALLGFGLLGLLQGSDMITFGDDDIAAIVGLLHKIDSFKHYPSLPVVRTLPKAMSINRHRLQVASHCLNLARDINRPPLLSEASMVRCLDQLLLKSTIWDTNNEFYVSEIAALCDARSNELQGFCIARLIKRGVPEMSDELVELMGNQGILTKLLVATTAGNDHVAPIAMQHLWGLVKQIIAWAPCEPGALSVLESFFSIAEFAQVKHSLGERPIPATVHELGLADKWFPRLQTLVKQAPGPVADSEIVDTMCGYYDTSDIDLADQWVEKLRGLQNFLAAKSTEAKREATPDDKENDIKNEQGQDVS